MNIELFIKQRGLNPQEKLDNNTGGYWKLKNLLEDFVECQNEGQSLPIDNVSNSDCPECKSTDIRTAIHTDYKECNKCYHYWEAKC